MKIQSVVLFAMVISVAMSGRIKKGELHRLNVETVKYDELVELLEELGFYKKSAHLDQVPEEYKMGPVAPPSGISYDDLVAGNFKLAHLGSVQSEKQTQPVHDEI
ncbi:hypothetical protein LOTGIDRAFT_160676 [Lottia gigantea]|uniref:Selenoprotein F/M domain-containing protein n=1 Tax=Lottia gigantea TaxID=225164 RepID=V4APF8_LOTGI|nr:hypothetical protein LOTGIDRAFT_160676 [Lottia gigantea]ESO95516.1 hypothetical protein LOTGIDRAFT_160676 [Lottia gigantea]